MASPLFVTFLWHMHQPYYRDPVSGEYILPWTYLHAVKDYYDMAAIVDETPGAKVVFNLVPSLLDQIEEYAQGTAIDPFLVRGKMAPADMNEEERQFVIGNFFSANRQRMIEPYRRYRQLFQLATSGTGSNHGARARNFKDQDILDLQVWFFLAWTGELSRRRHPEIQELMKKGKNFTEADKALLFSKQREILQGIIPLYKKLHDEGKAELAVSPYYHPILPLLCDSGSARAAMPKINLPQRFSHPEDARGQVRAAVTRFEQLFGFTPAGMWPSEGSVSDEALSVVSDCGLRWIASDEDILGQSQPEGLGVGKRNLYHPYLFSAGEKEVGIFFRDHALSDLIGFTYSQWEPARAAADFISRLGDIRAHNGDARVVSVILDGENAWEYYPDNGLEFLRLLYSGLAVNRNVEMTTFAEALDSLPPKQKLQHIHPGSWINGNFGIWIGHPEENAAWELLARARETAVARNPLVADLLSGKGGATDGDEVANRVRSSIYAAEGSDWFWWYGDDHFSSHGDRFDLLFRRNLLSVYDLLQIEPPRELFEPIKQESLPGFVRDPADLISPVINGMVSGYFEWLAAGLYDLTRHFSAMHAAESGLQSFYFGFDHKFFYFRIDGTEPMDKLLTPEDSLNLHLITDHEYLMSMRMDGDKGPLLAKREKSWISTGVNCCWKIVRVCEAQVPLAALKQEPGAKLMAFITLVRDGAEIGRWPKDSTMELKYAGPALEHETWIV